MSAPAFPTAPALMDRPTRLRPALLAAPDGGLPGIPGSGSSGSSGGLPGIPGSGPSSSPAPAPSITQQPTAQPAGPAPTFTEHQSQPSPQMPGAQVTYELSGWWRRVFAYLIDAFILLVVAVPLASVIGIGTTETGDGGAAFSAANGDALLFVGVWAVVVLIYAPLTMVTTKGSTLGKLVTGIRVVRADGAPMTFGYAAAREVGVKGILFGFLGALTFGLAQLVNDLWPLWDAENRALHDMIVKSRVVRR